MPRYSLRTLLILTTAIAIYLGWIAYLTRKANWHRAEAANLVSIIAVAENEKPAQVERDVAFVASGGQAPSITYTKDLDLIAVENGNKGRKVRADTADAWKAACEHQLSANKYARAVLRPWELFHGTPSP